MHRARHPLRIDVNVGDPVTPAPIEIAYPTLLGDPFPLTGYPIETLLAEKIVTMAHRGDTTTRERDFADVVLLTRREAIEANRLSKAINATARHRQTDKRPLRETLITLGSARQSDWERFIARNGLADELPYSYEEVIAYIVSFADPILTESITSGSWDRPTTGGTHRRRTAGGMTVGAFDRHAPPSVRPCQCGHLSEAVVPVRLCALYAPLIRPARKPVAGRPRYTTLCAPHRGAGPHAHVNSYSIVEATVQTHSSLLENHYRA